LSRERAIKNCVNCYELAKMIMLMKPNEELELKGSVALISLYNNAMKAAEKVPGKPGKAAVQLCVDCNFTAPKIANELRKTAKK
jgi:hypothetical protein